MRVLKCIGFCLAVVLTVCGCDGGEVDDEASRVMYEEQLRLSDPRAVPGPYPGSRIERLAIDRFVDFYRVYSAENVHGKVRQVYAGEAFFRDGLQMLKGLGDIEAYFLAVLDPVQSCSLEMVDVVVAGGEYYFRWEMDLALKRRPQEHIRGEGMSHVRFDDQGKVIFQQDYWDTALLYSRLPVVGWMISRIRAGI